MRLFQSEILLFVAVSRRWDLSIDLVAAVSRSYTLYPGFYLFPERLVPSAQRLKHLAPQVCPDSAPEHTSPALVLIINTACTEIVDESRFYSDISYQTQNVGFLFLWWDFKG